MIVTPIFMSLYLFAAYDIRDVLARGNLVRFFGHEVVWCCSE